VLRVNSKVSQHNNIHSTGEEDEGGEEKKVIGRKMESILKSLRDGESVLDLSPRSTVSGGVEDVYGEDRATEDQLVTPWTISVARSHSHTHFTSSRVQLLVVYMLMLNIVFHH